MHEIRLLVFLFFVFNNLNATAAPADEFAALLEESWEWQLSENPVFASRLGDRRFNDQWSDLSLEAIEDRFEQRRIFLRRLRAIDSSLLSETDQLNYDLFRRRLENSIDACR